MEARRISRRELMQGTAGAAAALSLPAGNSAQAPAPANTPSREEIADRARRMKWWHEARFGMFIHWGLYSVAGRHEWVQEMEGIPVAEYETLAQQFKPVPNAARAWARLARDSGMRYMVMTTKHHEGFCLFDSKLTGYCAPQQAAGRDLVREYVDAARAEGLRVGFYYSLMDWHHPDGARCETDEAARRRFVEYIHGQIREILTQYGRVDVLWYDVAWPLDAAGWESERMNQMVFRLQPDIIVNNRNRLPGDFSTPEQRISAEKEGRAWESCMTLNASWGYHRNDNDWKSPRRVIQNLIACARDGGNYLLNIGPRGDGSIPEESSRIFREVGQWLARNGEAIYTAERCPPMRSEFASFTRRGNTLYMHVYFWPGETVALSGLQVQVKSARLLATGKPVAFQQDRFRLRLTGLPDTPPDSPITTMAIECDAVPTQDQLRVRRENPRLGV
jgi:alpha-L-fucosidase